MTKQRLTRLMPLPWAILIVLSALASVSATPSAAGGFAGQGSARLKVLVIHGPNLNLLGLRGTSGWFRS